MKAARSVARGLAAALALVLAAGPAAAWEAQTTHAGLAEQAAASSSLHQRLIDLGFAGGLYEELTVPPADAPELIAALDRYSPIQGFVPDQRGRQYAVAWLVAGAVLADSNPTWAADHFLDPATGKGLRIDRGFAARVSELVAERLGRRAVPERGVAATDWVVSKDNPFGLPGFVDQYVKAVASATPGERARALAGALVAAGAIVHVLQDMGSPSHVRDDAEAHLDRVGPARDDLGSRFERIAALSYGRLGVPAGEAVARPSLRAYFTDADGQGLADLTAASYFSAHTLPRSVKVGADGRGAARGELARRLTASLRRPAPALPSRLNLLAASDEDGATLTGPGGVCLARYKVERGLLGWSLDDACMLDEVGQSLPRTVGYGAGLLDWLFRGELTVTAAKGVVAISAPSALGAGDLELLAVDGRGVRTSLSTQAVTSAASGAPLASVNTPAGARRVVALFHGVDDAGQPLVAVGSIAIE